MWDSSLGFNQYTIPALFIEASYDVIVPPAFLVGQEVTAPNLTYRKVETAHWAMLEDPVGVGKHLKEWFEGVVFAVKAKL